MPAGDVRRRVISRWDRWRDRITGDEDPTIIEPSN
jgi:hypothetical protein